MSFAKSIRECKAHPSLQAGNVYWLGASHSPRRILITHVDERMVCYVELYLAEHGEPKVSRSQRPIADDLILTAESTVRRNAELLANGPRWQQDAVNWQVAYIGGKLYEFHQTYRCLACGEDFDAPVEFMGRLVSSCCSDRYSELQDAGRYIGIMAGGPNG